MSTAYHSIEWHYKSIDTWLEGICKSHCNQHSWSSANMKWAPGKRSIFNVNDEYDEADLDAPDVDDNKDEKEALDEKVKIYPFINHCYVGQGNNP